MKVIDIIKNNLIYLRKQKNLSAERMAEVIGMSRQAYSSYENGTREISIESLKKLAEFYGLTLDVMTSSFLIDENHPTIKYTLIEYKHDTLEFSAIPIEISNITSSLIAVRISDLSTKLFETNLKNVNNHEMLFEYKGILRIGKVFYNEQGDGVIVENDKHTFFSRKQSTSLVFLGMLFAEINKNYEKSNFF